MPAPSTDQHLPVTFRRYHETNIRFAMFMEEPCNVFPDYCYAYSKEAGFYGVNYAAAIEQSCSLAFDSPSVLILVKALSKLGYKLSTKRLLFPNRHTAAREEKIKQAALKAATNKGFAKADAEVAAQEKAKVGYLIATGNIVDGMQFWGMPEPDNVSDLFWDDICLWEDANEANEYADQAFSKVEWWTIEVRRAPCQNSE
jgi:hypothetical protein